MTEYIIHIFHFWQVLIKYSGESVAECSESTGVRVGQAPPSRLQLSRLLSREYCNQVEKLQDRNQELEPNKSTKKTTYHASVFFLYILRRHIFLFAYLLSSGLKLAIFRAH